jgi:hypothetical protein
MSRNSKPRKAYRPGRLDHDPVSLAMTMAAKLDATQLPGMLDRIQARLDAFRTGAGNSEHWAALADSLNVAEGLAELGIAGDHRETFERGQQALAAVHGRAHGPRKSWTLRGPELQALDDALFVHSVQLQHCSQGELHKAVATVRRRMQQALKGNAGRGATVLQATGAGA